MIGLIGNDDITFEFVGKKILLGTVFGLKSNCYCRRSEGIESLLILVEGVFDNFPCPMSREVDPSSP
jgi:hypothetical protein